MKYNNPKNLAFITSLIVSGLFAVVYLLLYIVGANDGFVWWVFFISALIILLGSYIIFYYVLERFIYEKIKLIYKTILNQKVTDEEKKEKMQSGKNINVIDDVNQQVLDWASERNQEIERLKDLADYRREYVGNVSHELKTPIFNIQGYVLTLLDGGLDDPTINKKYLLRTEKSINRMITIVEDLEAIANLEAGALKMKKTNFNLKELTDEVLDLLEDKIKRKDVAVYYREEYEAPVVVYADRERIRQVVTNLLDNSIKYNSKKEGRKTKISFFDMDEHMLVEVTDNGSGVAKEDIPRLFERFYRTKMAREMGKKGSGLGLAIVKHIIEAHDETINVRSKLGYGTTFAFTIKKGT
ncbi:MAG: ATP-binding protein [Bacteroidales bacterium]